MIAVHGAMKSTFNMIKTTVLGGLLFLIPLAVVLVVLGKLAGVMRVAAEPFDAVVPVDSVLGVVLANVLAVALIVVVCFVAGLIAMNRLGQRVTETVENGLLAAVPAYTFVKGFTDSVAETDEMSSTFIPILVKFDDHAMLAFETERTAEDHVVVYLPGSPNPWSGNVVYVEAERVSPLDISVPDAVKTVRMLGRGTAEREVA